MQSTAPPQVADLPKHYGRTFRALGTLQGLWEGNRQGSVPLWELLNPKRIREHAVQTLTDHTHRRWAVGLVDNYKQELRNAFPSDTVENAAKHVQELRHLVHGLVDKVEDRGILD